MGLGLGGGGGGGGGQGQGKGVWRAFSSLWGFERRAGVGRGRGRGRGIVGREGKTGLLSWSRGMKVRSSVKKLCEGCKVCVLFFFSFFSFFFLQCFVLVGGLGLWGVLG